MSQPAPVDKSNQSRYLLAAFLAPMVVYMVLTSLEPQPPETPAAVEPAVSGEIPLADEGLEPLTEPNWLGLAIPGKYYPLFYTIKVAITAAVLANLPEDDPSSFRVLVRRADKQFPMRSPDVERAVGAEIVERRGWRVDLDPGAYRVRWTRSGAQPAEHTAWAAPDRKTLLFVPQGTSGPDVAGMSMHLLARTRAYEDYRPQTETVEQALSILRRGARRASLEDAERMLSARTSLTARLFAAAALATRADATSDRTRSRLAQAVRRLARWALARTSHPGFRLVAALQGLF